MSILLKLKNSLLRKPEVFKALSEPNRISMFKWLCGCGCASSVKDIAGCCELDLSVVSRHLNQMKQAGLLNSEKKGKEVLYSVNSSAFVSELRELADLIESCHCQSKQTHPKKGTLS